MDIDKRSELEHKLELLRQALKETKQLAETLIFNDRLYDETCGFADRIAAEIEKTKQLVSQAEDDEPIRISGLTPEELKLLKHAMNNLVAIGSQGLCQFNQKIQSAEWAPKFYCGWSAFDVVEALDDDERDWPDGVDRSLRESLQNNDNFHRKVLEDLEHRYDATNGCTWYELYYYLDLNISEFSKPCEQNSNP